MLPTFHDLLQFVPLGLAVGAVYGVSGVGIVVLYRTTGVLNFAYGAVGALGVFIAWQLIYKTSWCPNWLAFVICILFGGVVTLLYGLVFGPLFAARDPLVKSAATLGLTLILLAIMGWEWQANEVFPIPLPSDGWHNFGYQIGDVRVSWTKIIALVFAFGITAITWAFLRWTKLGTAYRAIANDREITATLGVPVRLVEASAWLGSGIVCGASGLLLSGLTNQLEAVLADVRRHLVARGGADRAPRVTLDHAVRRARDRRRRVVPPGLLSVAESEPAARAVPRNDPLRDRDRRPARARAAPRSDGSGGPVASMEVARAQRGVRVA